MLSEILPLGKTRIFFFFYLIRVLGIPTRLRPRRRINLGFFSWQGQENLIQSV